MLISVTNTTIAKEGKKFTEIMSLDNLECGTIRLLRMETIIITRPA